MVVMLAIERRTPIKLPGIGPIVQNPVNWQRIHRFDVLWQESSGATGRPSKLPVG